MQLDRVLTSLESISPWAERRLHRIRRLMTSVDSMSPRGQRKWRRIRRLIPHRLRWFYEGNPRIRGQMWYAERKLLYKTIRKYQPDVVCESGTWMGGGSTLFIAQALHDNGHGVLHTTEISPEFHHSAQENYRRHLRHLLPHVQFHLGDSTDIYAELLPSLQRVDVLLLDGAEDAEQTWREFTLFEPFLSPDAILMTHDWNTDKMARVRPHLTSAVEWRLERILNPPYSLGMAVSRRASSHHL